MFTLDQLGSVRIEVTQILNKEETSSTGSSLQQERFTGYEADLLTGVNYCDAAVAGCSTNSTPSPYKQQPVHFRNNQQSAESSSETSKANEGENDAGV